VNLERAIDNPGMEPLDEVYDKLAARYGRSGSGRASTLRLIGAYMILCSEGPAGLRRRGFSRMSIQLYRDKLVDAGVQLR
jgi:hypothetical protein